MTRRLSCVALLVFAITMSIGALAGSKSGTVTLYHDVQLNGTTIPAGEYTVKYDPNGGSTCLVKVMKEGKTVATANGELKQLASRPQRDQVVLQNDTGGLPALSEMDFHNSTTAITFNQGSTTASGK